MFTQICIKFRPFNKEKNVNQFTIYIYSLIDFARLTCENKTQQKKNTKKKIIEMMRFAWIIAVTNEYINCKFMNIFCVVYIIRATQNGFVIMRMQFYKATIIFHSNFEQFKICWYVLVAFHICNISTKIRNKVFQIRNHWHKNEQNVSFNHSAF